MSQQLVPTKQPQDLRIIVQSDAVREQLAAALPKYYSPDQFAVVVRTQINRNPKLSECDPTSLIACMLQAAQMGIVPDGRNGHLIPRWNGKADRMECTFQADYKGLVSLVRKNENVSDVYAEPVHENDDFEITKGLHRDMNHKVNVRQERGEFIGAYAVIAYKDGTYSWDFMAKTEIDAIRSRSQSANSGPWVTDYIEMAKKTVIKRLIKLADISQEVSDRIAADPDNRPNDITIKPANVPTQAALPPAQEATPAEEIPFVGEPTTKVEELPKAEPAEEPKQKLRKAPKKEDPKAKQEGPQPTERIDIIREKISVLGKTEAELIAALTEYQMAETGQTLSDLPESTLELVAKHWNEIEEELSK